MESGAAPVAPAPEPELLEGGPRPDRRSRRTRPILLVVIALVVSGLLAWQFWPRPVAPLTLTELQGVYAGMVRGDGTNDASLLRRDDDPDSWTAAPAECAPLFDTTTFERFPAESVDGVGTFWLAARWSTSMFTFRFPDAGVATRAYEQIDAALTACEGQQVDIARQQAPVRRQTLKIVRTPVTTASGIRDQLGYLYTPDDTTRFAVQVVRYENTVSWQFRNDSATGEYDPLSAQQVMDSLVAQIQSVVDLRP